MKFESPNRSLPNQRWTALDFLRGVTIALMILVNNPGDWGHIYPPLAHAEWHGATPTDFIFPFFLFIVGVSISLSFRRQLDKGITRARLYPKVGRRTARLFAFGLGMALLSYWAGWGDFRVAGVLQRIAIVFLCCSVLFLESSWKVHIYAASAILIGYWLALLLIPVPDTGSTGFAPADNLTSWFDRQFLPGSLYGVVHDPEGILSTLPAVATGITGMLAGHLFLKGMALRKLLGQYVAIGLGMIALGLTWNLNFPFNKNLWSSSYVLFTSGWAFLLLAFSTGLIDGKGWKLGVRPFLVFGSNAITVYILSFLFIFPFVLPLLGEGRSIQSELMAWLYGWIPDPRLASLAWAVSFLGICYLPIEVMYRKGIFLKV